MSYSDLSVQQYRVLEFIINQISLVGHPPTIREICDQFGFGSPRSASDHLRALERKGFIRRTRSPRGITLIYDRVWALFGIPVIGHLDPTMTRLAEASISGTLAPSDLYSQEEGLYAMRVPRDTSLPSAAVMAGDLLIVREGASADDGDLVVAHDGDRITLRRWGKPEPAIGLASEPPERSGSSPDPEKGRAVMGRVVQLVRGLA